MRPLAELFADLLPRAGDILPLRPPGDNGDFGDNQASARLAGRFEGGDSLATSGDISMKGGPVSPNVATVSPRQNGPQSKHWRGLSPLSPMSPASPEHSLSQGDAKPTADDRRACLDCRHYRPYSCGNHRRAGLFAPAVGRDLAALPQNCPGFDAKAVT